MLTLRSMHIGFPLSLAVAVMAGLAGSPASAQQSADVAQCSQTSEPAKAIDGCTRLLQSGQLEPSMRAVVHQLRGVAEQSQGRLGPAIRDFAEARRIDPNEPGVIAGLALLVDDVNARCFEGSTALTMLEACGVIIEHAGIAGISPEVVARARVARGVILLRDGKAQEAARDFEAALANRDRLTAEQIASAEAGLASGREPVPTATVVIGTAPDATSGPPAGEVVSSAPAAGATRSSAPAAAVIVAQGPPEPPPQALPESAPGAPLASGHTTSELAASQISSKRPPRPFPLAKRAAPACAPARTASRPAANSARIAWSKGNSHWR